jgi:hypothetical protein
MAIETPEEELKPCPQCGVRVPESEMLSCEICSNPICEFCARPDFGRSFCSVRCRGFFFWGDGDEDQKDD